MQRIKVKDLCARLPYGVKVHCKWYMYQEDNPTEDTGNLVDINIAKKTVLVERMTQTTKYMFNRCGCTIKPYLRPMYSMTEEEKKEYTSYCFEQPFLQKDKTPNLGSIPMCIDWLLSHHFDFRGLIEKGLALEAPEGMYN